MMMNKKIILSIFLVLFCCSLCRASWLEVLQDTLDGATKPPSGEGKIDLGLKEALNVGVKKSIAYLGKNNGYFANAAVKILLPEDVRQAESVLRGVGFGPELDEFTLSMNRAAEKAAPLAADIFADAIAGMSFDDASQILRGGNTAATDYLKQKTYDRLLTLFAPAVRKTMNEYKVTQKYDAIAGRIGKLPLVGRAVNLDVNQYVSSKALDGLFYAIAREEENIRTNPQARGTALLKEVFK